MVAKRQEYLQFWIVLGRLEWAAGVCWDCITLDILHSFHAPEIVYFWDAEVGEITNITTRIKYGYRDHCKQDGSSETLKP
jgi:hypothetical protein